MDAPFVFSQPCLQSSLMDLCVHPTFTQTIQTSTDSRPASGWSPENLIELNSLGSFVVFYVFLLFIVAFQRENQIYLNNYPTTVRTESVFVCFPVSVTKLSPSSPRIPKNEGRSRKVSQRCFPEPAGSKL